MGDPKSVFIWLPGETWMFAPVRGRTGRFVVLLSGFLYLVRSRASPPRPKWSKSTPPTPRLTDCIFNPPSPTPMLLSEFLTKSCVLQARPSPSG